MNNHQFNPLKSGIRGTGQLSQKRASTLFGLLAICVVFSGRQTCSLCRAQDNSSPTYVVQASASVITDKPDYMPGATAIITGSGFQPGETITLQVLHADGTPSTGADHEPWTVTADMSGSLQTSWHVCEDDCLGSSLRLTAIGSASGLKAEALFSDAAAANGGFESGNFNGWAVGNTCGSGSWVVYTGTATPLTGQAISAPPEGTYAAVTDQNGAGSHFLYQDLVLETGMKHTLTFSLYYNNQASAFYTPSSLNCGVNPNQQYRVDIVKPSAAIDSLATGDVLAMIYQTKPGDPLSKGPTSITFDLTPFAGATVRLRFAEVDNQLFFHAGVDNVALTSTPANQPPLAGAIPDQSGTYGTLFSYTFPTNVFIDPDTGETLSYSASGMPPGITFVGSTRTFSGTPTAVGTYTVSVTATDSGSPPLSASDSFTFVISPAPLLVATDDAARLYGDPNPVFTGTVTGLKNGDTITTSGWSADPSMPVGTYAITPVLSDPGQKQGNYTISYLSGTLTIRPAPLLVATDDAARLYGDPNPVFTGTVTGLKNGDTITTSGWSADPSMPVGTYAITPVLSDPAHKQGNYTISYLSGTLTIRPAPLLVATDDAARLYGDPNPVFIGTVTGLKNGDTITTSGWSADPSMPVGAYAITPVLSDPAHKQGNYTISYLSGTLTIRPAPLLVSTADATRAYGEPNPPFTGTAAGLKNGDNITVTGWSAGPTSPVGAYAITPVLNDPDHKQGNYVISYQSGTLAVVKATPVLVWTPPSDIGCGTPLSLAQLNATANVPGSFLYSPSAGTVLAPGMGQVLMAVFTPEDAADYNSATASETINVVASVSTVTGISPNAASAGDPGFTLAVTGACFTPDSVVLWNGSPRNTTYVSDTQLQAVIPSEDLASSPDLTLVGVTVQNPGGGVSNPQVFTLMSGAVGSVDGGVASAGQTVTVYDSPQTSGQSGVDATLQNAGGAPVLVSVGTYSGTPPSGLIFDAGANYYDVKVSGADAADSLTVNFYYPSTFTGSAENQLRLTYFDGTTWVPVRSSGNTMPLKNTADNLDGTVSGGRFTVVLDDTSRPKLTELNGTVFTLANTTPKVVVNGSADPIAVGTQSTLYIHYTAVGAPETQNISVDWGDGSVSNAVPTASGMTTATHVYSVAGVYTVQAAVADANGDIGTGQFRYVVVYDPNGGFVTGGGSFFSPPGAFATNPGLTGTATFGFTSKYLKGATTPSGNTEFQFRAAGLNFHSTSYQWLVVSGARAQYKGQGVVNGVAGYNFLLTAIDGQVTGGGGQDKLRMKIMDSAGVVVYDNLAGSADNADPTTMIQGSIVIHN